MARYTRNRTKAGFPYQAPGFRPRHDADLDAAFQQVRAGGGLTPLLDAVRRWCFEADSWRDPVARRGYQARVSRHVTDGPPPQLSG
jgi:hypothetical protein